MSSIPPNIIFIWTGTNSSIPIRWSEETSLSDRFLKGWGVQAVNTDKSASTHSHTSPTHTHNAVHHTHTFTTNTSSYGTNDNSSTGSGSNEDDHNHSGTTSTTAGTSDTLGATYSSYSNNPPYSKVIFIKASAGAILTNGHVSFSDSSTLPANWSKCDGNNSTPNFTDKYLLGVTAGGDAGATGGGLTNAHQITHSHTGSHSHTAALSYSGSNNRSVGGGSGGSIPNYHTHTLYLGARSDSFQNNADLAVQSETNIEPAFKKLYAIMKKGASNDLKIIGMWLGSVASIPKGWIICDGTNGTLDLQDKHIKITNTAVEIGTTGGSNTHTHAAQSHSHTINSSSHSDHGFSTSESENRSHTGGGSKTKGPHSHTQSAQGAGTVSYDSQNTTADSANNEPAYRTVIFIKRMFQVGGLLSIF